MPAQESNTFKINSKRIAKNTILLYIRMLVLLLISLYTSRIVLNALGESDYGLYNVVGGIVVLFSVVNGVLTAGTSRFLTYELGSGNEESLKTTFSAAFTLHLLAALVVLLLSETVGLWFLNTQLVIPPERMVAANWVFQFSVITCMLTLTQVPYSASIISHERMDIYAWTGLTEGVFKLGVAFFILYIDLTDKLIAYALLCMLWNAVLQIYYRFYCSKNFPESHLSRVKDKAVYKKLLTFSLWDFGGAMGSVVNTQGMSFLLNIFFGLVANAARGIAVQVESALQSFSSNYMTAVKPQIVKSYSIKDYTSFFRLIFESSKYSYFLLLVVTLPVFLECDSILKLWLVNVPENTAIFLKWIMVTHLFRAMSSPVIQGCHATGNIKYLNLYTLIVLFTLPCAWVAFKLGYPPVTIFIIHGFLRCLCNFIELYVLKKEVDFSIRSYLITVMLRCLWVTALVVILPAIIIFTMEPSFLRLCISTVVSVLSVGAGVFFLILEKAQREKLLEVAKNRIRK